MKRLLDISAWPGRWFLLVSIIVLPFLRFLLQNRYGVLSPESVAAVAVLLVSCAALAAITRNRALFLALALVSMVAMATIPTVRLLQPAVLLSPLWAGLLVLLLLAAAVWALGANFTVVLAVFTWSAFGVDVGQYMLGAGGERPRTPREAPLRGRPPVHVVYLVLDEQMGLAGLPPGIPECRSAAGAIEKTLARGGFRSYPYAYSNYPSTASSVPSLLNRQLLAKRRMFVDESSPGWQWGIHSFRENRLLAYYHRRGYRINLYQHKAINLASADFAVHRLHQYSDMLGELQRAPGPWPQRFRWIVGNYQQSDRVLQRAKAFFPFRFAPHTTGPLALGRSWPETLLADILDEPRDAVFFAHLMTPHFPYLYRRNGSIRNIAEWSLDRVDQRSDPAQYEDRYRRYCEQVEFLAWQLELLFAGLRHYGLYDSSLIVLHGDHGSRIRARLPGPDGAASLSDPEIYDYAGTPPLRDLLDRFSALLAVKPPGRTRARVDRRKASLLRLLSEAVPLDAQYGPGAAADSVYLFDAAGTPREIRMRDLWK